MTSGRAAAARPANGAGGDHATPSAVVDHVHQVMEFVHGDSKAEAGALEQHVTRSWVRCAGEYGIEPGSSRRTEVLAGGELRQRQEHFGKLLDIAHHEMESLYQQIAGSGYAVLLTDAEGTIVSSITDPVLRNEFRASGLWLGAVWDERHEGTNGISTALAESRPVTVHRSEHFMGYNIGLSCSGVPIRDPRGQVLAVLDASSVNSRDTRAIQRHTMALLGMSAELIEKCHFLNEFHEALVLRSHSRPEFVGLLHEALLAVDESGRVLAANRSALSQLGCQDDGARLRGAPVESLFQFDFSALARRAETAAGTLWPIRDVAHGRRFFATIRPPIRSGGRGGPLRRIHTRGEMREDSRWEMARRIAGGDPRMQRNLSAARRLVNCRVPLLLCGATGTGKEAFARALHAGSERAERPFVAVNCAAIPESLIESELFGYTAGAFTGASREGRRGKIQQAHGGTLFLDEIGDMPLGLQTRLLRVLDNSEVTPLGGEAPVTVDIHVISATHRDLDDRVASGEFREDLYYRLNGLTLALPPLCERADKGALI